MAAYLAAAARFLFGALLCNPWADHMRPPAPARKGLPAEGTLAPARLATGHDFNCAADAYFLATLHDGYLVVTGKQPEIHFVGKYDFSGHVVRSAIDKSRCPPDFVFARGDSFYLLGCTPKGTPKSERHSRPLILAGRNWTGISLSLDARLRSAPLASRNSGPHRETQA